MYRNLMTIGEVASLTRLAISTLRHYVSDGLVPVVKIGRSVRFDPEAIDQWVAEGGPKAGKSHDKCSHVVGKGYSE